MRWGEATWKFRLPLAIKLKLTFDLSGAQKTGARAAVTGYTFSLYVPVYLPKKPQTNHQRENYG